MTVHGSFVSLNKCAAAVWHLWRGESTVQWKVRAGFCSEVRNKWEEDQRWRLLWSYLRKWESVCVCLSDGSLHLPLFSRRTNYKVMDSRLITRATSGFKLAEPWSRAWSDGEGQERRGTWVQRENEVTARRKGKHLRGRAEFNKMYWQKRKKGLSHSPLVLCTSHTGSSFSLGCFWILFRLCRLHLCPPSPLRLPFILFHLHVFSLPFSLCFSFYSSQASTLCLLNESTSLCRRCVFFLTRCFRQTSGVPEHVLTTPTHHTSDSTFKWQKRTRTVASRHTRTLSHSRTWQLLCTCCSLEVQIKHNFSFCSLFSRHPIFNFFLFCLFLSL